MTNPSDIPNTPARPVESSLPVAPLFYESPIDRVQRDPPAHVLTATFLFGLGFFMTTGGLALLSVFVFMGVMVGGDNLISRFIFIAIYFIGVAGSALLTFRWFKNPALRQMMRWFSLGAALGLGVCCLLEGICFTVAK